MTVDGKRGERISVDHNTYFAIDKLYVSRTLCIAVPRSVSRPSFVARVFGSTAISGHFGKVKRTIETAWKGGHVDVESEFLVVKVEHLVVLIIRCHKVSTRANVGPPNEIESESIS